jgi:hypothetical protein
VWLASGCLRAATDPRLSRSREEDMGTPQAIRKSARRTGPAIVVTTLLVLGGCSASPQQKRSTTDSTATGTSQMSAYQRSIIGKDDTVTSAQYQAAFSAFESCATKAGGRVELLSRDPATGLITFQSRGVLGTPDAPALGSPEGVCYHEYFDEIDYIFQTTDPGVLQYQKQQDIEIYDRFVRPCLLKNHRPAPAKVTPGTSSFGQLAQEASTLEDEGKC